MQLDSVALRAFRRRQDMLELYVVVELSEDTLNTRSWHCRAVLDAHSSVTSSFGIRQKHSTQVGDRNGL